MPKELMPGAMLYLAHGEFTHVGTQQNLDNKQSAKGNSRNTHFKIHNRTIDPSLIFIRPTKQVWSAPLADLVDDSDVGEEMMMLRGGHGFPQSLVILEVPHQDAQTVQIGMLRRDDFKNGLSNRAKIGVRRNLNLSRVLFSVALQSQVLDRQMRLCE